MATSDRTLIGVVERLALPDWGVDHLRAKIDTGARTSALHVDEVEELDGDRVRFSIVLDRRKPDVRLQVEAPIARRGRVRSSSGRSQKRIIVCTRMVLGEVDKEIEISLASREPMIFRMLLGRQGLASDFFVDPANRYLQSDSKPPKKARVSTAAGAKPKKKANKKKASAAQPSEAAAKPAPKKKRAKKKRAASATATSRPKKKASKRSTKKVATKAPSTKAPKKKRPTRKKSKKTLAKQTSPSDAAAPSTRKKKTTKRASKKTGAADAAPAKKKRRAKKKASRRKPETAK